MRVERFDPYLGAAAALALAAAFLSLTGDATEYRLTENADFFAATSTLSASSSWPWPSFFEVVSVRLEAEADDADTPTTDAQEPAAAVPARPRAATDGAPRGRAPAPAGEVSSSSATTTPAQPAAGAPATQALSSVSGQAELDTSAAALRAALVNIICYAPAGSGLHSISGSGVFVDPKGAIITNAHIAQYFLLADRDVSCDIRVGSPAADTYDAALAYIPPEWVSANASVLAQAEPTGTGEYDFAFLAVTKSATGAPLPSSFPHIPLAATASSRFGAPVVIASYGAQFLAPGQIQSALFPTIVFGSVKGVFTFASSTIDVLALGGSAAAQEGSSGGGVADASGALTGIITTSTTEGATDTRKLDAITASYIRAEYAHETGQSLDALLVLPPSAATADFAPRIPALEALITAHLP